MYSTRKRWKSRERKKKKKEKRKKERKHSVRRKTNGIKLIHRTNIKKSK